MKALIAAICLSVLSANAPAVDMNPDTWDILDYKGDVRVEQVSVPDCPPGYGPDVLRIVGDQVLLLAKGGHLTDGTYVALYRERAAATKDADGVILIGGAYGDDLALEHNTKTMRPHLWLEQDNDTGLSFRMAPEEGADFAIAEAVATGLVTDPWNVTGWIWQKVQVSGDTIRAKYWPAQAAEPAAWQLETTQALPGDRFGIRINSGEIDLAYFEASAEDIAIPAPPYYLHLPRNTVGMGDALPLTLFGQKAAETQATYKILDQTDAVAAEGPLAFALNDPTGPLTLPRDLQEGAYRLQLTLPDATLTRDFTIAPPSDTAATLRARRTLLESLQPHTHLSPAVDETVQVATALLDLTQQYYDQGESDRATETLRFVDETLVELHGPAGDAQRAAEVALDWAAIPAEYDGKTGVGSPKHGMQDHYRPASRIRIGKVYGPSNAVMGRDLRVDIPFELVGNAPDVDYTIHIALKDQLGIRTVAEATISPSPPTSQWIPGKGYLQRVALPIPRDDTRKGVSQPVVLDEMHDLIVSLRHEETGTYVLLDNPPGHHPNRIGHGYVAKEIYVSSTPVEIYGGGIQNWEEGDELCIGIYNHGPAMAARVLFRVLAPSGLPLAEYTQDLDFPAAGEQIVRGMARIHTGKKYRGGAIADVQILGEKGLLTRMTAPMAREDLKENAPTFTRGKHVAPRESTASKEQHDSSVSIQTPIHFSPDGWTTPIDVTIHADGERLRSYTALTEPTTLHVPPHFGYYDITATSENTSWHERIVATVIETEGGQLLVNGEPFIVKGVNVHSMDSRSPARTRLMMEILKDRGFNSLRGDYPPRWQVDMAHEVSLTYDVLAPFSVSSTGEIFGRQDGPPLGTARALTRQFISRYADAAAVLLWNSCNEITDENIPFLIAQYPAYKIYDPYQRPVHYANLYGQDLWQGQDVMGVNYYFSDTQKAVDRQPLIERSAAIAAAHDLPMIYTEYNSYHGAIPTTGVEAMEDLFTWGVEKAGMAGGYFYMMPNSDRHPGVLDGGYNTHRIMDDAFHRAFDDASADVADVAGGTVTIEIENIRPFTLRNLRLELEARGKALDVGTLQDLSPGETQKVAIPMPEARAGNGLTLAGTLYFETHHGFPCRVPVRLLAEMG